MPEIRPEVDAEAVAVSYLNQDADFLALAGGPKASTELPRGWAPDPDGDPVRVRVTRVGGLPDPRDPVGHLDRARLQVDAFAASSADASDLCRLAISRLLMISSSGAEYPGAVVTGCRRDLGLQRRDDPSTEIESYFAGVVLFVHPSAV